MRRGRPRGALFGAFVFGLLVLALPASSSAAPTWLAPQDLSATGQNADGQEVALSPAGDAVAVWERPNGTNFIVQAATKPPGGAWGAAQNLSAAGQDASAERVALDPAGNAVAVWERSNGTNFIVQAATEPAGGAWSAAQDISAAGQDASVPHVALDAAGNALAVWQRFDGVTPVVQAATKPPGGAWGAPQTISGAYGFNPVVAVDAAGNAVAAWFHFDGATNVAQAVTRPAGGTWSAPQTLSVAGEPATIPEVAIDPAGNALAVWQRSDGSNYIIQAATKPAVGAWSTGQDLSAPGQDAFGPHVAVDAAGNAVAIWYRSNGTINVTQAATKPVGGAWSPAQDVSAGRGGIYPRVALDSAGNAVAVWQTSSGPNPTIQVATKAAGGAWSSVQDLSAVGETDQYPELALDPAGDAALAWQHLGTNSIVRAVGRDAAGPVFAGLSIPARGTVGTRLSFAVSPFDVWSALGPAPIWSFGDGGTAAGTRVRHTYGRAGAHRVTLTQADAVGNQSTTTRTITIAAACVVPKVSGKTLARAKAAIARAHCRTGKVTHAYSKKVRKGRVVSQSPKAGKRLTHGARVKLVVSRGKRR